jgi:peptidase A4-like protein
MTTTLLGTVGGGAVSSALPAVSESHAVRVAIPGPAGMRATSVAQPWDSRNWSGYAIPSGNFTSVSGSWTVPTVNPPNRLRARQFSSTWVGIDGYSDGDLIQAGTEQDWLGGAASYEAWWEILPADETRLTLAIHPGDVMDVTITQGSPDWTITVADASTGQSDSVQKPYSGPQSSAEWIQEAPTVGNHIAALANDGTVDFTNLTVNGTNPDLTIAESGVMAKKGGRVILSTPSDPSTAGNAFAVAFGSEQPLPPSI